MATVRVPAAGSAVTTMASDRLEPSTVSRRLPERETTWETARRRRKALRGLAGLWTQSSVGRAPSSPTKKRRPAEKVRSSAYRV